MFRFSQRNGTVLLALAFFLLSGCVATPEQILTLKPESLEQRQLQTRRFDTGDETKILAVCASLLQDLGFKIEESESKLGVLVASKMRSAYEGQQVATAVVMGLLGVPVPMHTEQLMKVVVATRPIGEGDKSCAVRVTIHRTVYDEQRRVAKVEELTDPKMYQTFFEKLSQALFLEAHES